MSLDNKKGITGIDLTSPVIKKKPPIEKTIKKKKIKLVKVFICQECKCKFQTNQQYTEHLKEHKNEIINIKQEPNSSSPPLTTTTITSTTTKQQSENSNKNATATTKTIPTIPTIQIKKENNLDEEQQQLPIIPFKKINSENHNNIIIKTESNTINNDANVHSFASKKKRLTKFFICTFCSQKFKHEAEFQEHLNEHRKNTDAFDEDKIQCEYCPHFSINMSKAIQHKHRLHPNFGNHYCQVCGKLFPIKIALTHHMKTAQHHYNDDILKISTDSGEKLTCALCLAQFITEAALSNHAKTAHTAIQSWITSSFVPPPSTKIVKGNTSELFSVYYCHLCGSDYMIKHNLKQHLLRDHTEADRNSQQPAELIRCIVCTAIFYTLKAFQTHQLNHTDNDLFATNEEERRKVVNRIDQDFDLSRVPITFPLGGNWLN